jgi:preprotein translocase subunit SecD
MKGTGRLVLSLTVVGVLVLGSVIGFLTSLRPILGLDLVGGVSVILSGPPGTSKDVMQKALDKIRERVDSLGVAEPDISLLGNNFIQVQLPGLGGQGKVVKRGTQWCAVSSTGKTIPNSCGSLSTAQAAAKAQSESAVLRLIGTTARLEEREVVSTLTPSNPQYKTTPFTVGVIKTNDPFRQSKDFHESPPLSNGGIVTFQDTNGDGFFTDGVDPKYLLGAVGLNGSHLKSASAQFVSASSSTTATQTGWEVVFTLDKIGTTQFAALTTRLVGKQLAIVLDSVVVSAPTVQSAITGGTGQITGNFSESQAKDLAVVLSSGALPVELTRQEVRTVSPTLGKQSLRQGLLAGIVGLIALMLYLAFYYRLLGIVTWIGMAIWGTFAIALVSLLGHAVGYALSLAGVAGIIVSLGITADSYIVFYERLKDEVRHGKTLRSAVVPAFKRSWRTIVAADTVTITAAVVLYLLAVGSVRGFALTLGLSTALDLVVVYFFKRPTVFLISRSPALTSLRGMGLRSGVAADPLPVAGGER